MTTAILSALPEEQGGLVQVLEQREQFQYAGRKFWRGRLQGQTVVLGLSGIGKVAAATTAAVLFERLGVQRIVFIGVAGGMGEGVQVGDVVVAMQFLQHDLDASPIFPRWEVPGYGGTRFSCDPALTAALFDSASAYLASTKIGITPHNGQVTPTHTAQVHRGLIISGDRFVSTLAESTALRTVLAAAGHQALAVEMEGAAVAQVCNDFDKPFAAVRIISDRADDNAHIDFPHFIQEVARPYVDHIITGFLQQQTA
jgi:adenosylhomocysteine nucleosidase